MLKINKRIRNAINNLLVSKGAMVSMAVHPCLNLVGGIYANVMRGKWKRQYISMVYRCFSLAERNPR